METLIDIVKLLYLLATILLACSTLVLLSYLLFSVVASYPAISGLLIGLALVCLGLKSDCE